MPECDKKHDSRHRLRFKKRHSSGTDTIESHAIDSNDGTSSDGNDSIINTQKCSNKDEEPSQISHLHSPSHSSHPSSPSSHAPQHPYPHIFQYGPEINGYRFIATQPDDIIEKISKKSNSSELESDSGTDSDLWDYPAYQKQWFSLKPGQSLDIPLPVATDTLDDVTPENLLDFLGSDENIRTERIRWHPDKMIIRLKSLGITEQSMPGCTKVVTRIFQELNKLYDARKSHLC